MHNRLSELRIPTSMAGPRNTPATPVEGIPETKMKNKNKNKDNGKLGKKKERLSIFKNDFSVASRREYQY